MGRHIPVVEHERLIRIAAQLLREKHGERAEAIAAQRAQQWAERHDGAAALLWLSIGDAVSNLEAATAPRGDRSLEEEADRAKRARRWLFAY